VGSTSAKLDPDEYIGLLIQLINIYKAKYLHLDLVVNTSGWVKGRKVRLFFNCFRCWF
jgi:polynucleotide 5'-kinase involved in rRNA processing